MTTEQIIKALECCCTPSFSCDECPYCNDSHCPTNLRKDAVALIKEQQAEIERLKLEKEGAEAGAMEAIKELQAQVENLKKENKYLRERLAEEAEINEDMKGK